MKVEIDIRVKCDDEAQRQDVRSWFDAGKAPPDWAHVADDGTDCIFRVDRDAVLSEQTLEGV